ncbi:MAG TPA: hypothetical protein VGI40_00680 [Pirellulaceae bacterium]|jgi:hypothetical protein
MKHHPPKRLSPKRSPVAAALCLNSGGCGDLVLRKLYRILSDKKAAAEGYLRIVDESGEDYLYPSDYFVLVRVPAAAARKLLVA